MPQSLASILVHIVFSTKNREPLIHPDLEPDLFRYMATLCTDAKSHVLLINGTTDHVHMLVNLGRTIAIADLVEEVKSHSSAWIKLKGRIYKDFYWQSGYGAFSIDRSGVDRLKNYIATQKTHHLGVTYQDEFRGLLQHYEIEYDERYVWD